MILSKSFFFIRIYLKLLQKKVENLFEFFFISKLSSDINIVSIYLQTENNSYNKPQTETFAFRSLLPPSDLDFSMSFLLLAELKTLWITNEVMRKIDKDNEYLQIIWWMMSKKLWRKKNIREVLGNHVIPCLTKFWVEEKIP